MSISLESKMDDVIYFIDQNQMRHFESLLRDLHVLCRGPVADGLSKIATELRANETSARLLCGND